MKEVLLSELKGKTLTKIEGMEKYSGSVKFYCTDGSAYEMYHSQECCESVLIDDVCGDVNDLIGSEILVADEIIHEGENPEGVEVPEYQDSFTWTFYKLATSKGYVDLRWYGESNGYYSESVDFRQIAFNELETEINDYIERNGFNAYAIDEKLKAAARYFAEWQKRRDAKNANNKTELANNKTEFISIGGQQYIVKNKIVSFGIAQDDKKKAFVWMDGGCSTTVSHENEAEAKEWIKRLAEIFNKEI